MCADKADHMEIQSRTAWRSDVGRRSKPLIKRGLGVLLVCAGFLSVSNPCVGQENTQVEQASADAAALENSPQPAAQNPQSTTTAKPAAQDTQSAEPAKPATKPKKEKKPARGAFVVAPLPISSPAIGTGIVPVLGYIFPFSTKDKVSPPSTIGAAGLITDNGSRGFAVGGQLFFKENTYELTTGYVHGNVDYNFYGTGAASNLKLPLVQTGQAFFAEFLRRVGWKFFVGPRFITGHSIVTVVPNSGSMVPIPPEVGLHDTLTSLGARITRDTRPNHFYPLGGTFFTFTSDFFSQGLGSKYTFQSYRSEFDKYWSLTDKQVLAYDAYFCGTGGAPRSTGIASTALVTNCEATRRANTSLATRSQPSWNTVWFCRSVLVLWCSAGSVV